MFSPVTHRDCISRDNNIMIHGAALMLTGSNLKREWYNDSFVYAINKCEDWCCVHELALLCICMSQPWNV